MHSILPSALLVCSLAVAAAALHATTTTLPTWTLLPKSTDQRYRGLSAVSDIVAWVAGTNGTVLRTTNAGQTWSSVFNLEPDIEFRDISAFSESEAIAMSIGNGETSTIYATSDGGATWTRGFQNEDELAFYDCIAFESRLVGLALSDPVDGKFRLIRTVDSGMSWALVHPTGMPAALTGEFAFAASGTCLTFLSCGKYYAASGGVNPGRIFRSSDSGKTWNVTDTPVAGGESAGVNSVVFQEAEHGIAVGGDYLVPNGSMGNAAWSKDGGVIWQASTVFPSGYRSGVAWIPGRYDIAIAVGPSGSDITRDGGKTWTNFDNGSYDSIECPTNGDVCWASGEKGRIARLTFDSCI